jgi:hypothetical protein
MRLANARTNGIASIRQQRVQIILSRSPTSRTLAARFERLSLNQSLRREVTGDVAENDRRRANRQRQHRRHTLRRERLTDQDQRRGKAKTQKDESGDGQKPRLSAKRGRIGTSLAHAETQAKIAPSAKRALRAWFTLRARRTITCLCGTENTVSLIRH